MGGPRVFTPNHVAGTINWGQDLALLYPAQRKLGMPWSIIVSLGFTVLNST